VCGAGKLQTGLGVCARAASPVERRSAGRFISYKCAEDAQRRRYEMVLTRAIHPAAESVMAGSKDGRDFCPIRSRHRSPQFFSGDSSNTVLAKSRLGATKSKFDDFTQTT